MSPADPSPRDLSRACWRCTHWGGFAHGRMEHARCARLNASPIQAGPETGCAFWQPGVNDERPAGWMPVGFVRRTGSRVYGAPPDPTMPSGPYSERPCLPGDRFAFDQKCDALAWRLTGELLNRARAAPGRG